MDYSAIANLPTMFFDRAKAEGARPFLWAKIDKQWRPRSYDTCAEQVVQLAHGLARLGVRGGDRVVIVSENRPDWAIADLAIMALGAISVPAYTTNTVEDHLYILEHSGASAVIVSTPKLAERVIAAAERAPDCTAVIVIDPMPRHPTVGVALHDWADVLALGKDGTSAEIEAIAKTLPREATACLIYTSGTGGRPKGVMLSHRSILANCHGAYQLLLTIGLGHEVFLSLLPLSHSYEHTGGLFLPISIGAEIYYCEGPDQLAANLQEVRPTIMTAVPRLYELLHDRILRGVAKQSPRQAAVFHAAVRLGRKRLADPSSLTLWERLQNRVLDLLVRRKVAARFGGRLKAFVSGGAALDPGIGSFFLALGMRLVQGYGQTEASPVITANPPLRIRIESVGPPLDGVEIAIAQDGEILVRGDLVMTGYWRDPETTAATLVDGWLRTGDIGYLDGDNYLIITDRKKDIIVNSGGDNIAPARVEGRLTLRSEIAQAMVQGDKRPYLVALIVPDVEFIKAFAQRHGCAADLATLAHDPAFHKALAAVVDGVNADLAQIEKIRRFAIAPQPFSTENQMMTPTLKIRRHVIRAQYGDVLEKLYARSG